MQVLKNPQVEKALARLRAMGLEVAVLSESENTGFIFVSLPSVIRLIERQIKYPLKKVYFQDPYIVIRVWRES